MEKYKPAYKCRLCGARFTDGAYTTDRDTAVAWLVNIAGGVRGAFLHEPAHRGLHECADGSLGLTDFLGMEKVQPRGLGLDEKTESGLFEED